jgi:CPA1 family monovalent cation:H+ antiporter
MSDTLGAFAIYLIAAVGLSAFLRLKDRDTLIPLILLGVLLSFIPSLSETQLQPQLVMVFFLVPLVFGSAMVASLRDLMKVGLPIVLMSFVPVALSVVTVGYSAHLLTDIPWGLAFALGAILSPTDTVALKSIVSKNPLPSILTDIMEGEALFNDVSGLTALHLAILALMAGGISTSEISLVFGKTLLVGTLVGVAAGYLGCWFLRRSTDSLSVNSLILVIPFSIYAVSEHYEGSGILAIVIAAIMIGMEQHTHLEFKGRLQSFVIWEHWVFILEATAFLLMGVQLPHILLGLTDPELHSVFVASFLIVFVLILTRFLSVFSLVILRKLFRTRRHLNWRSSFLLSWFGVRGPVSSMAAFAIPVSLASGEAVPGRDMALSIALVVIILTIMLSLTIKPLIRWLELSDGKDVHHNEMKIWVHLADKSIEQIDKWIHEAKAGDAQSSKIDLLEDARKEYQYRRNLLQQMLSISGGDESDFSKQYEKQKDFYYTDFLVSDLAIELACFERDALLALSQQKNREFESNVLRSVLRKTDIRLIFLNSSVVRGLPKKPDN